MQVIKPGNTASIRKLRRRCLGWESFGRYFLPNFTSFQCYVSKKKEAEITMFISYLEKVGRGKYWIKHTLLQ